MLLDHLDQAAAPVVVRAEGGIGYSVRHQRGFPGLGRRVRRAPAAVPSRPRRPVRSASASGARPSECRASPRIPAGRDRRPAPCPVVDQHARHRDPQHAPSPPLLPPTLRCPTAICPCYHPCHAARRSFPSSSLFPPCPSNRTVAYFGEHRLWTIVRSPFSRPPPANPWKTWPCNGVNFDGSGCTVLPDVPSDEASDGVNFRVAFGNRA